MTAVSILQTSKSSSQNCV